METKKVIKDQELKQVVGGGTTIKSVKPIIKKEEIRSKPTNGCIL